MSHKRTLVFIPTYNDFNKLQTLIDEVLATLDEVTVLVIDDGSTLQAPALEGCKYTRFPFNLGIGVSTRVALQYAVNNGFDLLVRIDADNQHPVSAIPQLVDEMDTADTCLGIRQNRHSVKGARSIMGTLARSYITLITRLISKNRLPRDLNTGFFCLNRKSIKTLVAHELDRYPEPQMFIILAAAGCKIGTHEIDQNERSEGKSTISASAGLKLLYRVTLYTLLSFMGAYKR